jgi:glycosyltransferase involved in cell wall biosynthesis
MLDIYVQRIPDETGKGKFIRRLTQASIPLDVNYSAGPQKCKALLDIGWWHGTKNDVPRVLRMDGAYDYNFQLMKDSVNTSDAVIWQGQYCMEYLYKAYNIKGKKEYMIRNGANPDDYKDPIKLFDGYNVIVSGSWMKGEFERMNKRLKETLRLAKYFVLKNPEICFWIAGNTTLQAHSHPRIKMLGPLVDKLLCKYIAGCDVMLNLSYNDWCPNAVVECLVAGKPVIYSDDGGGIVELVVDSGLMITPKHFEYEAIIDFIKMKPKICRPDLYISNIAKQYKEVFEEI